MNSWPLSMKMCQGSLHSKNTTTFNKQERACKEIGSHGKARVCNFIVLRRILTNDELCCLYKCLLWPPD